MTFRVDGDHIVPAYVYTLIGCYAISDMWLVRLDGRIVEIACQNCPSCNTVSMFRRSK